VGRASHTKQERAEHWKRRAAPPLEQALQEVAVVEEAALGPEELCAPRLHLFLPDGSVVLILLATPGAGPEYAALARALIASRPYPVQAAVVATEAWMATTVSEQGDPGGEPDPFLRDWLARRAAGEPLGVVDLPPDYRREVLVLYGEDREGHDAVRLYQITPRVGPAPAKRGIVPLTRRAGTESGGGGKGYERMPQNRFRPLFAVQAALRAGYSEEFARQVMTLEVASLGIDLRCIVERRL
jgi:hypothetical protein